MTSSAPSSNDPKPRQQRSAADLSIAVVIVNYRTAELTESCLRSLSPEKATLPKLRVVVVDGASEDGSAEKLAGTVTKAEYRDWVSLLPLPINGGFGWANNQAIHSVMSNSPAEFIHLLNPDCEIEPHAVEFLADYLLDHPKTAAVGSQLLEPAGPVTASAYSFPTVRGEFARGARTAIIERILKVPAISIQSSRATEVDWVTGASVMFRSEALREVGLFDEGFFLYHEEVELMWRLRRAGWEIATEPRSRVRHIGGAATRVRWSDASEMKQPRWPAYMYRSRTRFFALTRGRLRAALSYLAWLAGHAIFRARVALGLGRGAKMVDHELLDHLSKAFPRKHDSIRAVQSLDGSPTKLPAWMERKWL